MSEGRHTTLGRRPSTLLVVGVILALTALHLVHLEADVPAQAIEVFKASITGMTMCLGIIGGLAKLKDVVAAAAGKPGKK